MTSLGLFAHRWPSSFDVVHTSATLAPTFMVRPVLLAADGRAAQPSCSERTRVAEHSLRRPRAFPNTRAARYRASAFLGFHELPVAPPAATVIHSPFDTARSGRPGGRGGGLGGSPGAPCQTNCGHDRQTEGFGGRFCSPLPPPPSTPAATDALATFLPNKNRPPGRFVAPSRPKKNVVRPGQCASPVGNFCLSALTFSVCLL